MSAMTQRIALKIVSLFFAMWFDPYPIVAQIAETSPSLQESRPPLAERIDQVIAKIDSGPEIPLASDSEFLRRICLDLIGRGPTVAETRSFLEAIEEGRTSSIDARRELIDDLLARDEFSRYYSKALEVMLTERREVIGTLELRAMIRQWLEDRRPLNELCTEMLAADGTGGELRAAAGFILNRNAEPHLVTRDIGRIFFGRDVQCAQCHDHPLVADYEQAEYFGILSFVNRTYLFQDEKRGNLPFLGEKGEGSLEFASVFRPEAGKSIAQPVLPMAMAMDAEPDYVDSADAYVVAPEKDRRGVPRYSRRQQLAVLATHRENQSFNRNLANRLWAGLMGVGVVHPVDMHHTDNPPVSAALLRVLSEELVACNYDLREFLRQITRSHAYQRSAIISQFEKWEGPPGGLQAIDAQTVELNAEQQRLEPQTTSLNVELEAAAKRLQRAQEDVDKLQQQVNQARKQLQQMSEQRDKDVVRLTELQSKQTEQQELTTSLQTVLNEADKVLAMTPEDQELVAARKTLNNRLTTAGDAKPMIDSEVSEQQEVVDKTNNQIEDQRSRIVALANRRLSLGEFVVEARGVQRSVRNRMQAVIDLQADHEQQKRRMADVRNWLDLRNQVQQLSSNTDEAAHSDLQLKFDLQQTELLESYRRSFALRRVRGLSPEQLAGATYTALEMDRAVREKALADWETSSQTSLADRNDEKKRQAFVSAALANHMWDTVENPIVTRFSAPAGAPQDGFFATVDQALMIQNDPAYQSWLKPQAGNLIERLLAMDDGEQFAVELYLIVLNRRPESDETQMVCDLLTLNADQRASMVQELVWGLMASSEFRFVY